jgi:outer membrane scaffolding protein for murein synthesis (MipA/OmpV family)
MAQDGAAAPVAPPAPPQRPAGPPLGVAAPDGWTLSIGLAPVVSPVWQGSTDAALSIFPDLRVNYRDILFASVPEGIGWNAVRRDGWRAGPLVKLRFSRDERNGGSPFLISGGSDALLGLGNVPAAGEAGLFVEKRLGDRGAVRLRGEVRQGFGGHDGIVADLSASYGGRAGRTLWSIGPRATLAGRDYVQTYFGVTPGQSAASGITPFSADGGLVSVGIGGTAIRTIGRSYVLTLFGGVDRLSGDAGGSTLVQERGQRMQTTIGLGLSRRIRL